MTKGIGGLTYTRQIPAFLQKLQERADDEGIKGALKRREGQEEPDERSDTEEERPVVVETSEAMTAKERKHSSGGSRAERSGLFKGDDTASKFSDSAHARHMEWEEQRLKRTAEEAGRGSDVAPAAADGDRHSFAAPAKKKRSKGVGAVKAVRNTGLLSFGDEVDGEE